MVLGFKNAKAFGPVVGWELYQVTFDKYHVMFFFENGWQLLNIAHSFSHYSSDGQVNYTYELYGSAKKSEIDRLLRKRVVEVEIFAADQLALHFDNGDELVVHDDASTRSWWFMPISAPDYPEKALGWSMGDADP
jgi:hypothetical protein